MAECSCEGETWNRSLFLSLFVSGMPLREMQPLGGIRLGRGGAAEIDPLGQRVSDLISHETHVGFEPSNFH